MLINMTTSSIFFYTQKSLKSSPLKGHAINFIYRDGQLIIDMYTWESGHFSTQKKEEVKL